VRAANVRKAGRALEQYRLRLTQPDDKIARQNNKPERDCFVYQKQSRSSGANLTLTTQAAGDSPHQIKG
jgi:hypothetical protein